MRNLKKLGTFVVALLALSAIGVASASAATFTASATGKLEGHALNTQVFTTNGGTVKCTAAKTTGNILFTATTEQHVTVEYSGCTAFGGFKATVSPATYIFTASGVVHIENIITIDVPGLLCKVTVGGQSVNSVIYDNNSFHTKIIETSTISNIAYSSSGGFCGTSGTNGTYTGNNEIERLNGGSVTYDS
ncbi:MAG TPA: hypothetical protein VKA35_04905 [Solirubrobacterales bacterium]|nr:hypothetical protein [Solirubrobacterales bacterium]